jgi:hypothetical protein
VLMLRGIVDPDAGRFTARMSLAPPKKALPAQLAGTC